MKAAFLIILPLSMFAEGEGQKYYNPYSNGYGNRISRAVSGLGSPDGGYRSYGYNPVFTLYNYPYDNSNALNRGLFGIDGHSFRGVNYLRQNPRFGRFRYIDGLYAKRGIGSGFRPALKAAGSIHDGLYPGDSDQRVIRLGFGANRYHVFNPAFTRSGIRDRQLFRAYFASGNDDDDDCDDDDDDADDDDNCGPPPEQMDFRARSPFYVFNKFPRLRMMRKLIF